MEVPPGEETSPAVELATIALLARCLGDVNRLRILHGLATGKKSVTALVDELGLSQPLVSHHLKELRRALLVNVERSGPFVYYELADPGVLDILARLGRLGGERLAARKGLL
jgi:DNA-binding transcriptional ArsR family regulator